MKTCLVLDAEETAEAVDRYLRLVKGVVRTDQVIHINYPTFVYIETEEPLLCPQCGGAESYEGDEGCGVWCSRCDVRMD